MRVTGGSFRGRKLQVPLGKEVRPTTNKVRQAIFNILIHEIADARVLDLFAGSGAMGIEALSRGAQSATFIENQRSALEYLRRNFSKMDISPPTLEVDWLRGIKELTRQNQQFDLIFADPPYGQFTGDSIAEPILGENSTKAKSLLAPEGILIIESDVSDEPATKMRLLKERIFDTTRINFYAK